SAGVGWLRRRGPPGKSKWPGPRGPGHSTLLRRSLRAASGTLQLRTSGQLDGVAGLDLDLFTGLRVATLASGTLGALNGEPAGDGELFALGHDIGEDIEDTIEDIRDLRLGQAGILGNFCNELTAVLSHKSVLIRTGRYVTGPFFRGRTSSRLPAGLSDSRQLAVVSHYAKSNSREADLTAGTTRTTIE